MYLRKKIFQRELDVVLINIFSLIFFPKMSLSKRYPPKYSGLYKKLKHEWVKEEEDRSKLG